MTERRRGSDRRVLRLSGRPCACGITGPTPSTRQWRKTTSEGVYLIRYCAQCDGIYESISQALDPVSLA